MWHALQLQIGVLTWCFYQSGSADQTKPHIVIILADDVGWNDFGFHGSAQIPTPNIDALAYNGAILNKFYTQQTCTPSRAALLTGNYPIRSGMQGHPLSAGENRSLPMDMPLMSEHLKKIGYSTHMVGKWHLGAAYRRVTPTGRGFDSHFGYWNGYCGYFDYITDEVNGLSFSGFDLHKEFVPEYNYSGRYATELFTEKSLEIIDAHKDSSKPLFLILNHLAGHTGRHSTELGVPDIEETNKKYGYIEDEKRRRFTDIVNIMDNSVGQLVDRLSTNNMLKNSIIIFFSDNGAPTSGTMNNAGSNWPLRGLKFSLFEGGVRGSTIFYSPKLKTQSYINNELIHITDLLPTLYHAAGGNISDLGQIDGIDQWNTISENSPTTREELLVNINEKKKYAAIIGYKGRYKFMNGSTETIQDQNGYHGESGRGTEVPKYNFEDVLNSPTNKAIEKLSCKKLTKEKIEETREKLDLSQCRAANDTSYMFCKPFCLFDLTKDPCETTDVLDKNPSIVASLKQRLLYFYNNLVPQTNMDQDPLSNPKLYNNTWYTWLDTIKI